jgi:hypothetical protein
MGCRIRLSFALLVVTSVAAEAQVGRDVVERGSNRAQISEGNQALERDAKEIERFSAQLATLEQAVVQGNGSTANQAFSALSQLIASEVEQGAAKADAAKKELTGAVSETGSNRRESRRNRDDSDAFGRTDDDESDAIRDGLNRADDVRDAADEKADLESIVKRAQRQGQIAESMAGFQVSLESETGRQQASQQLAMLTEFQQLMNDDLAATEQEIAEDRGEAGEDRRETRDDLSEADELDDRYRRETGDRGRRRR